MAPPPQITWDTLKIGKLTTADVIPILGTPQRIRTEGDTTTSEYQSSYPNYPTLLFSQKNIVTLIRKRISPKDGKGYAEEIRTLGTPDFTINTKDFSDAFPLGVYLGKGKAYAVGAGNVVMEIWYFTPMTKEEFMKQFISFVDTSESKDIPEPPAKVPPFAPSH